MAALFVFLISAALLLCGMAVFWFEPVIGAIMLLTGVFGLRWYDELS